MFSVVNRGAGSVIGALPLGAFTMFISCCLQEFACLESLHNG